MLPSAPLGSHAYRASLLTHESQHFSDYTRYPQLAQPDLEYRAKLAELWASRETTAKLLDGFAASMQRERALPHPFADHWVVTRLRERGHDRPRPRARHRAQLLIEHDAALERLGAARVVTALPD